MSTNLSKQKRDDLLSKIKAIRAYIAAAPQDENTGSLLTYLSDLEKDVNGKKYGLVFEEHREAIDEVLDTHTPVLTEEPDLLIDHGGEINFLLEGDNLAALKPLEKTHRGRIDLIYIEEAVAGMIRCAFRHSVKVYQKQSLYLPSDTEGCAEGFIFCPQTAVLSALPLPMGVHTINDAHAHNEKPSPVTIYKLLRYESVHIVDYIEYRRIPLTFLPFRVMYGHYNSEGGIAVV